MAHWFHRNPLKGTAEQSFEIKMVQMDVEAVKVCSDLKQSRKRLISLLPDPEHSMSQVETALNLYLAILRGFLEPPAVAPSSRQSAEGTDDGDRGTGGTRPSKLRHSLKFTWNHSVASPSGSGVKPESQSDAAYEAANLLMNVSFWMMKHAAAVAAKDDLQMEEAKEVHTALRKASGLIAFVKDTLTPQLLERPGEGTDLDSRVISAYLNQCTAEAQEVTIARAVELKHSASLISSLAYETSKMYTTATDSLASLEQKSFGRWRAYLALKAKFYISYAYSYQGENLLAQDKCGEAIRSLQESKKSYQEACELAKEYAKAKGGGGGTQAKPDQHKFFRRLAPIVNRTLEKCERENGLIYHQKVAYDPPDLSINDKTFGLVSPEPWELPKTAPLWTPVAYTAFDVALNPKDEAGSKKKDAGKKDPKVEPVVEKEIKQSDKDRDNESGCTIS